MTTVAYRDNESGMALITTLMVLMLMSALMVGFFAAVTTDQRANGIDRDQTQAYAVAHAGLEKLTSDLAGLFITDFSPNTTQITGLTATTSQPSISGFQYTDPLVGTAGSGYSIATGTVENRTISSGPYQGFRGLITPYTLTVTARSNSGGAEVRLRRVLETVSVPVFQFGVFSETDLSFYGGDNFDFGGRVQTNGNLYLAEAIGATLTLSDRVTAAGEIIRRELSNGVSTRSNATYSGTVRAIKAPGSYRNLATTEGSVIDGMGPPTSSYSLSYNEPTWTNLSVGTYKSNIRSSKTGGKRMTLPIVSFGAQPIDLIRRPAQNSNEDTTNALVYGQRYFGMASLRILLSDTAADITSLPTVTANAPVPLSGTPAGFNGGAGIFAPFATSGGAGATGILPANSYLSNAGEPLLNGFIKIELQTAATPPVWQDVTMEILNLGITGRNISNGVLNQPQGYQNGGVPVTPNPCPNEPNPNAVIRLQRVRDRPTNNVVYLNCGLNALGTVISPDATDYWPNMLYDAREGNPRDANAVGSITLALSGIMNYVELDVNNLRRWFAGTIGVTGTQATNNNNNGYIVYFSDRRNNRNAANAETGEYGDEDRINPAAGSGAPNNILDAGEDVNGSTVLDVYGRTPRNLPAGATTPMDGAAVPTDTANVTTSRARVNRPVFFRRALKLVNGGINGGVSSIPAGGMSLASENPVYVQGNFNATAASATAAPALPAAILADSVTLLSNSWNDIRSFIVPNDPSGTSGILAGNPKGRFASTTGYRFAVVAGKTLSFAKPSWEASPFLYGTDGSVGNFLRLLENWNNAANPFVRYTGSIVSLYISRQATGGFKCCNNVYTWPGRNFAFDVNFLTPTLLPPGTPMFRDVDTLTFRQLLRPTE